MFNQYISIIAIVCLPTVLFGQDEGMKADEEAVLAPVHALFDGMRAGDSTMVRAAFDPLARLVTTFYKEGKPAHHVTAIDDFVRIVGTPHDKVFDEQIWDLKTEVRDNLASVWMKYAFFLGGELSHCGVNSFELFNTEDGWKIMHLADTRQKEGCEMPSDGP